MKSSETGGLHSVPNNSDLRGIATREPDGAGLSATVGPAATEGTDESHSLNLAIEKSKFWNESMA